MTDPDKREMIEEEEGDTENKTELANRIAEQSRKVANTYQHIEDGFLRIIRWFSDILDRILFNRRYGKLTALVLAVLMYVSVNFNSMSAVYTSTLQSSRRLEDVTITAKYNSDTFELSGLPQTADVTISGDATNVTNAITSGGVIVADLEGMTEGTHEVRLQGEGFGSNVDVVSNPTTVMVTLKKKTTQQFDLSYDFIHLSAMESIYSVGTPEFEYTKVNVRASRDTLDSIAFVKALIDVSGQAADFEQDAHLIAYDSAGVPVSADIVPSTVHVFVPVTSPNKTVPVVVQVSGEIAAEGMAIESITADQQTVTIYGPESILGKIDNVVVTLNASNITKDSTILRPVVLPTGVSSSNINQITMTIVLGEEAERTIEDVKINYKNNLNNYKVSQPNNQTTVSVKVTGTQSNIDAVTADDISVYVDMIDAKPGLSEFQLQVDQPADGMVKYQITEPAYELNVLGETTDDGENGGADENNG